MFFPKISTVLGFIFRSIIHFLKKIFYLREMGGKRKRDKQTTPLSTEHGSLTGALNPGTLRS